MRILHLADLHLQHTWFDWVTSHCREFDLLVIAGDLQNAFSNTSMHDQARAITEWLLTLETPTIVCSGNHDYWVSADSAAEAGWLRQLRGSGMVIGVDGDIFSFQGLNHSGAWLKFSVNGWLQVPAHDHPIDVLVTHAPPEGCACAGDAALHDNGDPALWDAIKSAQPRLLLCGHIHHPRSLWCRWPPSYETTLVLVPGCDEQAEAPAHWVIDRDSGIATHSSGQTAHLLT